jgi:hypothetical protein
MANVCRADAQIRLEKLAAHRMRLKCNLAPEGSSGSDATAGGKRGAPDGSKGSSKKQKKA